MPKGHLAYLAAKTGGDQSMPGTRELSEDVYGAVLQDPRDMAKAGLPEAQSPALQAYFPRSPRLSRGHRRRAVMTVSRVTSGRWAMASEVIEGDERAAYVTLDTSSVRGTGDRLQDASPRATEPP